MEKTVSTPNNNILVKDVMMKPDEFPVISERVILKEALEAMGKTRLGIACIVDAGNQLLGQRNHQGMILIRGIDSWRIFGIPKREGLFK